MRHVIFAVSLSEIKCPLLSSFISGSVTCRKHSTLVSCNTKRCAIGTTCTYTCDTGYQLVGTSAGICRSSGSWSIVPQCQGKKHTCSFYLVYMWKVFLDAFIGGLRDMTLKIYWLQSRIKGGGQRGKLSRAQLPRAPRCKEDPRDEIYLFKKNTCLKNLVFQKGCKNTTLYNIPMLCVNDDTAVVRITCFAPRNVVHVQTPFL